MPTSRNKGKYANHRRWIARVASGGCASTRFLLNEFYDIGRIPDWEHTISVIRSRGISATMILQSLTQLKTNYEKEAGTLVDRCDVFVHLGGKSNDTSKEVAEMIGKMGKMECLVLIAGCDPFRSRKYAAKGHKRYAWVDPHPEGRYTAKFDAEAYVRKMALVREAQLERERAIQAERRRIVARTAKRAEARKLTAMVNEGVGRTYLVG